MSKLTNNVIPHKVSGSQYSADEFELTRKAINAAQVEEYDATYSYSKDEECYKVSGENSEIKTFYKSAKDNNIDGSFNLWVTHTTASTGDIPTIETNLFGDTPVAQGESYWDGDTLIGNGAGGFTEFFTNGNRLDPSTNLFLYALDPEDFDTSALDEIDPDWQEHMTNSVNVTIRENGVNKITFTSPNMLILYILVGYFKFGYKGSNGEYSFIKPEWNVDSIIDVRIPFPTVIDWEFLFTNDPVKSYYTKTEMRAYSPLMRAINNTAVNNQPWQNQPANYENLILFEYKVNLTWQEGVDQNGLGYNTPQIFTAQISNRIGNDIRMVFDQTDLSNKATIFNWIQQQWSRVYPDIQNLYPKNMEYPAGYEDGYEDKFIWEIKCADAYWNDCVIRCRTLDVTSEFMTFWITAHYSLLGNAVDTYKGDNLLNKLMIPYDANDPANSIGVQVFQNGIYHKNDNIHSGVTHKRLLYEGDNPLTPEVVAALPVIDTIENLNASNIPVNGLYKTSSGFIKYRVLAATTLGPQPLP